MNYEILIFLFILFSVISTIINKIQEYRRHQTENSSQNKSPNKGDLSNSPLEDEFEYLEQESFELDRVDESEEHRGVLVGLNNIEKSAGEEFGKVKDKSQVEEVYPKSHQVQKSSSFLSPGILDKKSVSKGKRTLGQSKKMKKKIRLDFRTLNLRKAVIFNEILGRPRGEEIS